MNADMGTNHPFYYIVTPLLLALLLTPMPASALWPKTEADFAALPPYCKPRFQEDRYPEQARKWINILGKSTYLHIHHYCKGLFNLMKAQASIPPNETLLRIALKQWDYVDQHWPHNSKLRPEMLVKRGDTLILLGQISEGLISYQTAMKKKPDYSLPYLRMADYFLKQGERDEALKWLDKGSRQAPRSNKIRRKLRQLKKEANPAQ